jgi:CRISPR-associated protein (Cas_Cmr5).
MKQRIENYLPHAINAIITLHIANNNGQVASQYNGYISSLGASIIQTGLLPTIAFFSSTTSRSEKNTQKNN